MDIQQGQSVIYTDEKGNKYPALIHDPKIGDGVVDLFIFVPAEEGYRRDKKDVPFKNNVEVGAPHWEIKI